ncbi:hypothetical protein [Mongoliitalea daihaiensis]|uniref:hypothetical protein n=1 Tax=Mongoliitalea daihaiensis TaxID=2782006 RepID=UPI001F39B3CB|nr:hypothetical protein [Mongoliitalea daihaiensis]
MGRLTIDFLNKYLASLAACFGGFAPLRAYHFFCAFVSLWRWSLADIGDWTDLAQMNFRIALLISGLLLRLCAFASLLFLLRLRVFVAMSLADIGDWADLAQMNFRIALLISGLLLRLCEPIISFVPS